MATHWTGICDTQISYVTNPRISRLVAKDGLVNSGPLGPVARAARVIPIFRRVDHQEKDQIELQTNEKSEPSSTVSGGMSGEQQQVDKSVSTRSGNKGSFAAIFDALAGPEPYNTVTVMPEGVSHDKPHMLELKVGAALWAFGTLEHHPECPLQMVCVGIESLAKDCLRSHFHAEWGLPFTVPPELLTEYLDNRHLGKHNPAPAKLMAYVAAEFAKVTVQAADNDTKALYHLARKLFQPDELSTGLLDRYYSTEYWRCAMDYGRVCEAHPEREDVQTVQAALAEYQHRLKEARVVDGVVVRCNGGACQGLFFGLLWLVGAVGASLVLLGPGVLLSPFLLVAWLLTTGMVAGDVTRHQNKFNDLTYQGEDIWLTYFYTFAYPLVPLLFLIYSTVLAVLMNGLPDASAPWGLLWGLLGITVLPLVTLAVGVLSFDVTMQAWSACTSHLSSVCMGNRLAQLRAQRVFVQALLRILLMHEAGDTRRESEEYQRIRSLGTTHRDQIAV